MSDIGIPARRSAIYLLDQIMGEGKLMSEGIGAGALDRLDPADRARRAATIDAIRISTIAEITSA